MNLNSIEEHDPLGSTLAREWHTVFQYGQSLGADLATQIHWLYMSDTVWIILAHSKLIEASSRCLKKIKRCLTHNSN